MKNDTEILEIARRTLQAEADAILGLIPALKNDFVVIVRSILEAHGRVIITGIGKSAIIAQKIVATFNSTGTPAAYMHAGDAIHGDLGIIQNDDIIICISKSGNTPEIKVLIPFLRSAGNTLICITGDVNSYLAQQSDFILDTTVEMEACPNNLAPTTSTTAQLAIGDALAVSLIECREFSSKDFAKYHPGGTLGKKLYLKVGDLSSNHGQPKVTPQTSVKDVIVEITKSSVGAVAVIEGEKICGIITDGDIRRMIEKYDNLHGLQASDIMGRFPKTISKAELAAGAFEVMKQNNITQLLVVDDEKYEGIIHLHDLLKEGLI